MSVMKEGIYVFWIESIEMKFKWGFFSFFCNKPSFSKNSHPISVHPSPQTRVWGTVESESLCLAVAPAAEVRKVAAVREVSRICDDSGVTLPVH